MFLDKSVFEWSEALTDGVGDFEIRVRFKDVLRDDDHDRAVVEFVDLFSREIKEPLSAVLLAIAAGNGISQ